MPLDAATQTLVDEAECASCQIPSGLIYYAVLAALIDVANGDPVPTDSQTLIDEAACLEGCIPAGYLPYVLLQAVRGIAPGGGGTGGSGMTGVVDPEGSAVATVGTTYYNTANQTFWVKETGAGNTGWVQVV